MISKPIDPDLISREHAAALLGVSSRHLDKLAATGIAPAPYRFNPRCVLFSKREVMAFLEGQNGDKKPREIVRTVADAET